MDNIVQIISNLGFPIGCVIVMFYMWNKERESHETEVKELREIIAEVKTSIINNTSALNMLVEKLFRGDSK